MYVGEEKNIYLIELCFRNFINGKLICLYLDLERVFEVKKIVVLI